LPTLTRAAVLQPPSVQSHAFDHHYICFLKKAKEFTVYISW
jgi:hypothetical protein